MPAVKHLARITWLHTQSGRASLLALCALSLSGFLLLLAAHSRVPVAAAQGQPSALRGESKEEADSKSVGCISCHTATDEPTMHPTRTFYLGCADCHGGDYKITGPAGASPTSAEYISAKQKAHVQPRTAIFKGRTAVPPGVFTTWNKESYEYVKFINPSDLRAALKPECPYCA